MKTMTNKIYRHNKKGCLSNILLLFFSILICLLLAEAGIRLFAPQKLITQYSKIWRSDDVYGWRHQENISTVINSGEGVVHFVTDKDGYRINTDSENKEFNQIKKENGKGAKEYSILFIGDSYLEAIQVENHFTIPQVIRKSFIQDSAVNVTVMNASCGRWNPNHYLLEAQRFGPEHFDLAIVFLYAGNDIVDKKVNKFSPREIHVHRFRVPKKFTFREIIDSILYPLNEELEGHSHFYVFIKERTKWLRMKLGLSPYYIPEVITTKLQTSSCWQTTTEICKSIYDEFSRYNTPCFFVLVPIDFQTDERIFDSYVKSLDVDTTLVDRVQPQRILQSLFTAASLPLIDPLEDMRSHVKAGKQLYGFIDSHLKEDGHKAVAEYIEPTIRTILFEDKAVGGPDGK